MGLGEALQKTASSLSPALGQRLTCSASDFPKQLTGLVLDTGEDRDMPPGPKLIPFLILTYPLSHCSSL